MRVIGPDGGVQELPAEVQKQVGNALMQSLMMGQSAFPGSYGDPGFRPKEGLPQLTGEAGRAIAEYLYKGFTEPIKKTMGPLYGEGAPNYEDVLGATMIGMGAGWKGGLPAGTTGVGSNIRLKGYHATTKNFDNFDINAPRRTPTKDLTGEGIYFYGDKADAERLWIDPKLGKNRRILEKEVSMENPFMFKKYDELYEYTGVSHRDPDKARKLTEALKEMGHDGWIKQYQTKEGIDEFVTFNTGNIGRSKIDIPDAIKSLQRPGQPRSMVSITELRNKLGMGSKEFDNEMLRLAREGKIALHPHDFPGSLSKEAKDSLIIIDDPNAYTGKSYFNGVSLTGTVRLYRGQLKEYPPVSETPKLGELERGRWFTTDKEAAEFYGDVYYVDVPKSVANASIESGTMYNKTGRLLPAEWANKKKLISTLKD